MSHDCSVAIHHWLSRKKEDLDARLQDAQNKNDSAAQDFVKGQLQELAYFRQYLSHNVDLATQTYYTREP